MKIIISDVNNNFLSRAHGWSIGPKARPRKAHSHFIQLGRDRCVCVCVCVCVYKYVCVYIIHAHAHAKRDSVSMGRDVLLM